MGAQIDDFISPSKNENFMHEILELVAKFHRLAAAARQDPRGRRQRGDQKEKKNSELPQWSKGQCPKRTS